MGTSSFTDVSTDVSREKESAWFCCLPRMSLVKYLKHCFPPTQSSASTDHPTKPANQRTSTSSTSQASETMTASTPGTPETTWFCFLRRGRTSHPKVGSFPPAQSHASTDTPAKQSIQRTSTSSTSQASEPMPASPGTPEDIHSIRRFSFRELRHATRNFDAANLLGEGGFGKVYRGAVPRPGSGPLEVAIKTLREGGFQGAREWLSEITLLENLKHDNLVSLVGYSYDQDRPMTLVYELAHRGSLDSVLFSTKPADFLSWQQRMQIALDVARALEYLHHNNVIHRDFKPANVLIHQDLTARVTDFGLAAQGPTDDNTHVSTAIKGTIAYLDPQYWKTGHLTKGSDTYAFGITLLEILSGRPSGQNMTDWARPLLAPHKPHVDMIVDPRLEGSYPRQAALMASVVAKKCIEEETSLRPPMSLVRKHMEIVLDCN